MIAGIDYGSKLAGTTAICHLDASDNLVVLQSSKKQDADKWLIDFVGTHRPTLIGIDAPLSLPAAFYHEGNDYHYRSCDKSLNAMSPMFLGGLTARAISFTSQIKRLCQAETIEVYPKGLVDFMNLSESYNKKSSDFTSFLNMIKPQLPFDLIIGPDSWHGVDSILAWWSCYRFFKGISEGVGDPKEGLIHI